MFASLKNKIREETGSDLSKLTAKITSSTVQTIDSIRGKSHQGSTCSLNSIVSSDGFRDEGPIEAEEVRKRLTKIETDFLRKLEQKDHEWREIISEKDKQIQYLEREKVEGHKQVQNLKESLRQAEDLNHRILAHKENNEQIENLQTQELSKVKHLVLLRDQELSEKTTALKEANLQLEKLKTQIARLMRQEELLSDVQDDLEALRHSSSKDLAHLASELAKSEQERKHLADLVVVLRQSAPNGDNMDDKDKRLLSERKLLEQRLEEAHIHLADIKTSWSDKIASLETQVGRLSRQAAEEGSERRRATQEKEKLSEKVKQLEAELEYNNFDLSNKETKINRLTKDMQEISTELKAIKSENDENVTFLRTELVSRKSNQI